MSHDQADLARLFVYGTLRPGGRWWHVVEPWVSAGCEASTPGALYVRIDGYPAAVLDEASTSRVHGAVLDLLVWQLDAVWAELDEFEGDEYVRVVVTTSAGAAWAYHYLGAVEPHDHVADGRYREPSTLE
jgi:gamma-glutamylcyclotransferase (GGCT)/AIG2-like uncharacterized protein YtfP